MVLYPGRRRLVLLTILCLIGMRLGGGLVSILCGFGALVYVGILIPGAAWLKLDANGFVVRSWFREASYRWVDIEKFTLITRRAMGVIPVSRSVGYLFSETFRKRGIMSRMAKAIVPFDCTLPDNYGMTAKDLAALMEACRQGAVPAGRLAPASIDPV